MTVDEVGKLLNDTEKFLKAKTEGVIDEATKRDLALRIVEFEKSCIEIGLDDYEKTDTAEEVADLLINDSHRFFRWLENKGLDFVDEIRHKAIEKENAEKKIDR